MDEQTSGLTALILAAGPALRWGGDISKQLMQVPGTAETILGRMIRQAETRGAYPVVVTRNLAIQDTGCVFYEPENYEVTCDTLASTRPLWKRRTIVLLGDVVYSKAAMDAVFAFTGDIGVFGNKGEIFALSFSDAVHERVLDALAIGRTHRSGKLRFFYRAYMGWSPGTIKIDDVVYRWVLDWTMDVDSVPWYGNLCLLANDGVIDDLPE